VSKLKAAVLILMLAALSAHAGDAEYPEIRVLSRDDLLYVQLQDELESYYKASRQREPGPLPPVGLFVYRKKQTDDLFLLNARMNLPYDTLATLNRLSEAREIRRLDRILVPTQPGIFVPDPPVTELERMMLGSRLDRGLSPRKLVVWRDGKAAAFSFFPGSSFSDVERAYFLLVLFRFPITQGSVTSRYGPRLDPFSGRQEFHNGLDIGAPEGADVHAARAGVVSEAATNSVLGRYVVLAHSGGYQTVYGHLSTVNVTFGARVPTGGVIGAVGRTGKATGPHLHFEVRRKGQATDPAGLFLAGK
jgi:murein DD-endopeptidase MepM/ murein hydrolase activator NlpD